MNKIISKILIFMLCIIICSSCSCDKNDNLVVYRNYYDTDVTTFNYMITNEYQDIIRIANLVDGLVENDKYGNIVPSIAKSWKSEIIDNKQIWTFYLKDNVYWSDYTGNKYSLVTANDFVTTLKYSLNYNTKSNNYSLAGNLIENGMNYYNGTLIKNFNYNDVISKINSLIINDPNYELTFYTNIKNVFDYCNLSNSCSDDFETVGVKAIDDFTLQYTLEKPVPYFLSALTYYSFLPTCEKFIKEIGFNNFGTNKKTLLYNGAYILDHYFHSSRLEYTKNQNYWDKDNVFIDKLIFTKALNYHSISYTRLAYENGNIDEFTVNELDEIGWKRYVTGNDNKGTVTAPIGNNTYVNTEITNFTAYYILFNQNRKNYKYSTLSLEEATLANKAMSNLNFRKALTHGINRSYYVMNDFNSIISSLVPETFIIENNKDYNNYFIETYSNKNDISYDDSKTLFENDPYYNLEKSHYYLNLAIEEMKLSKEDLPIKIEYTYYYSEDYSIYDANRIERWNKELNGCTDSIDCKFDKVQIVLNTKVDSKNDFFLAFNNKEYNLTYLGLYPDYNDPTTYLNAFGSNGELNSFLNHSEGYMIDNMINTINNYYLENQLEERYTICSELEYYIIFEKNLVLPLSLKGSERKIVVSNLTPYLKMKSNYGLSPFKFKFRKLTNEKLSQEMITKLKEEYEEGIE